MVPLMEDDKSPKLNPRRMKAWLQRGARRRSAHQIISKITKAAFFETKLVKRIRSRKLRQELSRQAEPSDSSNPNLTDEEDPSSWQSSFSKTSSSLTISSSLNRSSSYLSSSTTLNSCVLPIESKHSTRNQTHITNHYGWYLLLVSLVSVILFGRFLAVLSTVAWLLLVPSRRASCANEDNWTVTKISNADDDQSSLSRDHMFGRFLATLWTAAWLFLVPSRRARCANEDNQTVTKTSNAVDQSSLSIAHMSRAVMVYYTGTTTVTFL